MHGNIVYVIVSNVTFGFGSQTSCSFIQTFLYFSLFLQIFAFKPNRNNVPSHRKSQTGSQREQKTQGSSCTVVSTMYIMFKVPLLLGIKWAEIFKNYSSFQWPTWCLGQHLYKFFTERSSVFSWLLAWCSPKEMA